jgi:RES domain-containing protein
MAEVAVHLSLATMPSDYMMVTILIPDEVRIKKLSAAQLPQDWNQFPHPSSTQQIGNRFIAENKYAVLRVPSAVTKGDYNLLINPAHPDCKKIKITSIEKFPFDKRIFK